MSAMERPEEVVDWSAVIETNLREQLAAAERRAVAVDVELAVERELHDEEEARLTARVAEVEVERDRARATAVRLEQELAQPHAGMIGYYILSTTGEDESWDATVHPTREDAEKSLAGITERPDWYVGQRVEAWEVVGLVRLVPQS